MIIRKDLEARFGIPFDELMREYAARGISRSEAGRQLGVNPNSLRQILLRGYDPFMPQDAAMRYLRQNGESLATAAARLAKTHTLNQAAQLLGVQHQALRRALEARGITIEFKKRYGAGRKQKPPKKWNSYEVNGVKGSIRELTAMFASVPLSTVRHRIHGSQWSVEKAVLTPYVEVENRDRILAKRKADYARRNRKAG